MGFRIRDLQQANIPLAGTEIVEIEQGENSRKVAISDLLPGFSSLPDTAIEVHKFGPLDTPENSHVTIMAAHSAARATGQELWFVGGAGGGLNGRYDWLGGVNLAANYLTIRAFGKVELHCVTDAVALRLGEESGNNYRFNLLGEFKVTGNENTPASGGVVIRSLNHSNVHLDAWSMPGLVYSIKSGVCTNLYLRSTGAGQDMTVRPGKGIEIDSVGPGDYLCDSKVFFIIEDMVAKPALFLAGDGVDLIDVNGCKLYGTPENNEGYGLREGPKCKNNEFHRIWCEGNGNGDIITASNSTYYNSHTQSNAITDNVKITGKGAKFIGGYLRCVERTSTSSDTLLIGVEVSNHPALGIKGVGLSKNIDCVLSDNDGVVTGKYTDVLGAISSFTPYLFGSTTAGALTYSGRSGRSEVIGGRMFFDLTLTVSGITTAMVGPVAIGGFTLPAESAAGLSVAGTITHFGGVGLPGAGYTGLAWRVAPGGNSLLLLATGYDKSIATLAPGSFPAGATISISGSYPLPAKL